MYPHDEGKILCSNDITQYFIDGTYKCVPNLVPSTNVLIIIIGYNANLQKNELCLVATFTKEDKDTYIQFYSLLKAKFKFKPKRITCDFCKSNLLAINEVFSEEKTLTITCFFHLIQSWWRKAGKLGMRKKNILQKSRNLIFNLKLLPFMDIYNAREFYLSIKEYFSEEQFNEFYIYFEQTWLNMEDNDNVKYEFKTWSYYNKFDFKKARNKKLISQESLDEYIFISNNCCESLNNLINNYIHVNSKVSIDRFESIIKTLFLRFECCRGNDNQCEERIAHKRVLSDVLLDIINSGYGINKKIINETQFKKLKLKPDENSIFKILQVYDTNTDDISPDALDE